MRGNNEGVNPTRFGMGEERKIDLVKSAIRKRKDHFMMEPCGPDEPVATRAVPGFDIGRSYDKIGFRFDPVKKMTKTHRLF